MVQQLNQKHILAFVLLLCLLGAQDIDPTPVPPNDLTDPTNLDGQAQDIAEAEGVGAGDVQQAAPENIALRSEEAEALKRALDEHK